MKKFLLPLQILFKPTGGGSEIRTHVRLASPTVFKTGPLNRSGIPPIKIYVFVKILFQILFSNIFQSRMPDFYY